MAVVEKEEDEDVNPPVESAPTKVEMASKSSSTPSTKPRDALSAELESELHLQPGDDGATSLFSKLEEGHNSPDCSEEVPPETTRTGVGRGGRNEEAEINVQRTSPAFTGNQQPPKDNASGLQTEEDDTKLEKNNEVSSWVGSAHSVASRQQNPADMEKLETLPTLPELSDAEPEQQPLPGTIPWREPEHSNETGGVPDTFETATSVETGESCTTLTSTGSSSQRPTSLVPAGALQTSVIAPSGDAGNSCNQLGASATPPPATSEAIKINSNRPPQSTLAAAVGQTSHELLETFHSDASTKGAATDEHPEKSVTNAEISASDEQSEIIASPAQDDFLSQCSGAAANNSGTSCTVNNTTDRDSSEFGSAIENDCTTQCSGEAATTSSNAHSENLVSAAENNSCRRPFSAAATRTSNRESDNTMGAVEDNAFARSARDAINSESYEQSASNVISQGTFVSLRDSRWNTPASEPPTNRQSGFSMATQLNRPPEERGAYAATVTLDIEVEFECRVCRDRWTEYVFLPCGHGSCSPCFGRLRRRCHSCREWIESVALIRQLREEDYSGWDIPLHLDREEASDQNGPIREQMGATAPDGVFMELHPIVQGTALDELRLIQGAQEDPRYPMMRDERTRLRSLRQFWRGPGSPEILARTGLFAHGPSTQEVLCFHCGNGIRIHSDTADPWHLHRRLFPRCRFLRGSLRRNRRNTV